VSGGDPAEDAAAEDETHGKTKPKPFDPVQLDLLPNVADQSRRLAKSPGGKVPPPQEESDANADDADADTDALFRPDAPLRYFVKPRHWATAVERRKANEADVPGGQLVVEVQTGDGDAVPLANLDYALDVTRPAVLAKGKEKFLEYRFLPSSGANLFLNTELNEARSGRNLQPAEMFLLSRLPEQTYFMVVLSTERTRYKFWPKLDTIRAPGPMNYEYDYRLLLPPVTKTVPLPAQFQGWTSTAVLIWDNVDPTLFTPEQQSALTDWLHWGGVLVINGPAALDKLRGSFLDADPARSYLPLSAHQADKLSPERLAAINAYWSKRAPSVQLPEPFRGRVPPPKEIPPLQMLKPWSIISGKLASGAKAVPHTADTLLAREVGRGRVVVTAFSLTQPELETWPGFDSFVNGAILGREPRVFSAPAENAFGNTNYLASRASRPFQKRAAMDSYHNTRLRYLTRDWTSSGFPQGEPAAAVSSGKQLAAIAQLFTTPIVESHVAAAAPTAQPDFAAPAANNQTATPAKQPAAPARPAAFDTPNSSTAAWRDQGFLPDTARNALGEASGIDIPDVSFVIGLLVIYLGVLVVGNYMIFRVIGRVEYAWAAAPFLAILGSLAVIKLAQLDIGFVRAQTEIAILECYPNYPRGHLTRYTALYSSLSTTYELTFADSTSAALPFPARAGEIPRDPLRPISTVRLSEIENGVGLDGFQVSSNSTAMVHSEQMLDMGGSFEFAPRAGKQFVLRNKTKHHLKSAGVLRRTTEGVLQTAWVGELRPGDGTTVDFLNVVKPKAEQPLFSGWRDYDPTSNAAGGGVTAIPLDKLLAAVTAAATMSPNEVRLIAIIPGQMPGLTISPEAAQSERSLTLLVAHLQSGTHWEHRRDWNTRGDVLRTLKNFDSSLPILPFDMQPSPQGATPKVP